MGHKYIQEMSDDLQVRVCRNRSRGRCTYVMHAHESRAQPLREREKRDRERQREGGGGGIYYSISNLLQPLNFNTTSTSTVGAA